MATYIDLGASRKEKECCHFMPCSIDFDGEANVSTFFEPTINRDTKGGKDLTASLRGRPLNGTEMFVPSGYKGLVLHEPRLQTTEDEDRRLVVTHTFDKFTAWNLDKQPTLDDSIQRAMQWIDIATAIHRPIDPNENGPSSEDSPEILKGK